MTEEASVHFSSALPIILLARPSGQTEIDWREIDRGPGYFTLPASEDLRVRIKSINDQDLYELVKELKDVPTLRFLDLAENRNVTNEGLARLKALTQLTGLNLSSCTISNAGLEHLRALPNLAYLNLSYCNHLSDPALKTLEAMRNLTFVDLQSCLGLTKGGLSRVRRRTLTIFR